MFWQYLLEGILHSEERCLKDERLVAYSAMFETWSLMALMLVGRGSSYVVTNYAPLLACVHAIYAAACNVWARFRVFLVGSHRGGGRRALSGATHQFRCC